MGPDDESVIYMSEPAYRFVCCMFYWKPMHTNLYLLWDSHHLPANKQSVLDSLIHRVKALCDQDSLTQELEFLTNVFKKNGFSPQQIQQALKPVTHTAKTNERPTLIAFISNRQHMIGSAERWLNATSKVSLYHQGKSKATFHPSRMLWNLRALGV